MSFEEDNVLGEVIDRRGPICVSPLDLSGYQAPFPQVKQNEEVKKRYDKNRKEFIKIFKKANINIPFINAIKKMPPYAKFLKEIF